MLVLTSLKYFRFLSGIVIFLRSSSATEIWMCVISLEVRNVLKGINYCHSHILICYLSKVFLYIMHCLRTSQTMMQACLVMWKILTHLQKRPLNYLDLDIFILLFSLFSICNNFYHKAKPVLIFSR